MSQLIQKYLKKADTQLRMLKENNDLFQEGVIHRCRRHVLKCSINTGIFFIMIALYGGS
jgi:hypothetical protein